MKLKGGDIYSNYAKNVEGSKTDNTNGYGGAICIYDAFSTEKSICRVEISGTVNVYKNWCSKDGGGLYIRSNRTTGTGSLEVEMVNGTIGGETFSDGNKAITGNGGGFCVEQGTVSVLGGVIAFNEAGGNGGGFYSNPGSNEHTDINSTITTTIINNNKASRGGGAYAQSGTVNISSSATQINNNEATIEGGGIYANGGVTSITGGNICYNEADEDGGGIYANGGMVTVNYSAATDGKIHHNYAAQRGGGLFISNTGRLDLKGKTTLEYNRVPEGALGGGIYLEGTVQAGASSTDAIVVKDNYASNTVTSTVTSSNRNNIYLPNPVDTQTSGVITVVNNGLNLSSSKIGFSVPHNFVPVIYCATASYLSPTIMNSYAIFEDSERYTKYYSTTSPYKPNYIYLSADTWFAKVASQPDGFSLDNIDSPEDLAWLISLVNGRTTPPVSASNLSGATINLTADLDMKAYSWVPIGYTGKSFNGTFNGNGHTISNVYCSYLGEGEGGTGRGLGLFGTVEDATIHDVFIDGVELQVRNQTGSDAYTMGAIANEAKGATNIFNCMASSSMESTMANTTMGGLVGKLTEGTIHSSAAMPDMTGYQMGGLVGQMASGGSLYNSFANAKVTPQSGSTDYIGGLVGVNAGRIENCYSRIQNTSNPSPSYFGWIAGQNNSGTITYCYIPTTDYGATYVKGGTAADNNCTSFGMTSIPYLYKHADNQMTANSNNGNIINGALDRNGHKGLVATLNNWVAANSGYATWMRTSASPINDDYPIHNYTNYVCVASKDNIGLEYSADFNTKFGEYITANRGSLYLYQSPTAAVTSTLSNSGGVPALYIHEDVVMLHSSAIKAHVGITLDNSAGTNGANPSFGGSDAIDWHFFSSALSDAPIGLAYVDNNQYEAFHYPSWNATFTAENAANGYFPTNLDSYYSDWDLYAYSEPDYHWINLKRNSASHWHEDYSDIHITYTNETAFLPGHGYMVALKEEGYLQACGTLNTHSASNPLEVEIKYTEDVSWTNRQGHNLLGNPYQSYLDFDEFARDEQNRALWETADPFYVIMDEDQRDYVLYAVGQSANESQASRYLHPHQGFMIVSDKAGTARFHDGMRTLTAESGWASGFRGESQPNYPLVNLFAEDADGNRDIVTVELGRPDKGGALKQDALRAGKGSLSCHYDNEDYALVFTQPGLDAANIRFATNEDGVFTMTWNTQNGDFNYLHLIDNMTGADIDCLSQSEYTFSARESDYNSRFRLVFGYTGIDDHEVPEPSVPEPVEGPTPFAYYANGEIHLVETQNLASLEIIDMTGRTIVSKDAACPISTKGMAAGVYVLRLTTANGTKTQKIIID